MQRVYSRINPILDFLKGFKEKPSILYIGCIGMGSNDTFQISPDGKIVAGKDWHLPAVRELSSKLVGIDIIKDKIDKLNSLGYDIRCQSADEEFDLGEKFSVCICEEVIEHLCDLRIFLSNVKRHLKEDGLFVITSPSPFGWVYVLQRILYGKERSNNFHTHWQSEKTMKYLLESNGFEVTDVQYIDAVSENLQGRIAQNFLRWLPHHWGINVIYQARLKKDAQ